MRQQTHTPRASSARALSSLTFEPSVRAHDLTGRVTRPTRMRPLTTPPFAAPAQRRFLPACMAAAAFLFTSATYGQAGQGPAAGGPAPGDGQQNPAPVNPQSLS